MILFSYAVPNYLQVDCLNFKVLKIRIINFGKGQFLSHFDMGSLINLEQLDPDGSEIPEVLICQITVKIDSKSNL